MNYLLKITFSLLLFQLVIASETEEIATETDGIASETEGSVDAMQEAHEREHLDRRADFIANRAFNRKHPPPPVNVVPNEIDERYNCIPYSEYIDILNVKFENETMEKLSEEKYLTHCEEFEQHNVMYRQMVFTYAKGKNHLMYKTFEEAKDNLCGTILPHTSRALTYKQSLALYPNPTGKSETEKLFCNFHQPVRDQDSCGSCWAFSVVAILENLYGRYKGVTPCLSEQMLVDCDKYNYGCDGGWPTNALYYIENFGLSDCRYNYVNHEEKCKKTKYKQLVLPSAIERIEEPLDGDEALLKRIVAAKGAVVVVMHISDSMFGYATGVYLDDTCPKGAADVNHAVVICGYGVDPLYGPYWTVRNSWSKFWGELGYVRVARGRNTCGIATVSAMYAQFA